MITTKLLQRRHLFSSLPPNMLAGLAAKAADIRLAPGEWLAREGERLAFFVILRGSLELTKEIEGRAIHISDYNSGDFFGEVNTLFGIPALSSLRARTTCRIAAFELQQLQGMLQSRTKCGDIIFESLRKGLEGGPRHAMGLPAVRVRIGGQQNDPSLTRVLAFLKSNRIHYETVKETTTVCVSNPDPRALSPGLLIDGVPVRRPWTERSIADAYGLDTRPYRPHYDVVIIGGGPAGLAAAVYGASEGLRVLLIEQ